MAMSYGLDAGVQLQARVRDFFLLHSIQIDSGAHPASYPIGVRGSFPRGRGQSVKLTIHVHLVLRSKMMELYLSSPIHLHGIQR
jgi:hypothetical protein